MARVFKRGKNWYIDIKIAGKRIRQAVGKSKKEAQKLLLYYEGKKVENEYGLINEMERKKSVPYFHEFARIYLKYSKTNKALNTFKIDSIIINKHLIPFFGPLKLDEIDPEEIEKYKNSRMIKVRTKTINNELIVIYAILSKAVEWGVITSKPKIRKLKQIKNPPRFLAEKECQALLGSCNDTIYPLVFVALNTGMRKSELLNLRWDCIDFENRSIIIKSVEGGKEESWHTKNYEFRTIPLNDELYEFLLSYRNRTGGYVFCQKDGSPYRDLRESFKSAVKKAGLEGVTLHTLRHTFASHLIMAGVDLPTVQKLMGHKDIATTMIYAHLAPDHIRSSVSKLKISGKKFGTNMAQVVKFDFSKKG